MTRASILIPILMAACSSSGDGQTTSSLTAADYDDTAQAVASTTVGDGNGGEVSAMSDSANIALGVMPFGFVVVAGGEIQGNRLGLDYSLSIACEDASGNSLAQCNAATDRADVNIAWSGALDTSNFDAAVERTGSWTLDGLQSNVISIDGSSTFSYDATLLSIFRPGARASFSLDASADYQAVAIDGATHDAIGGSASFSLDARKVVVGTDADVDKSFSVDADIEFHADRTATLTLDGEHVYTMNLATGIVVRAN
jgi:hypothetical protein